MAFQHYAVAAIIAKKMSYADDDDCTPVPSCLQGAIMMAHCQSVLAPSNWKPAEGVPNHWLPIDTVFNKDPRSGYYAIARRADGKLEACTAPGLWVELTDQAFWNAKVQS